MFVCLFVCFVCFVCLFVYALTSSQHFLSERKGESAIQTYTTMNHVVLYTCTYKPINVSFTHCHIAVEAVIEVRFFSFLL